MISSTSMTQGWQQVAVRKAPIVLHTWRDVIAAAQDLPSDQRDLVLQLVPEAADQDVVSGVSITDRRWFIRSLEVRGHVGIGESKLTLSFDPIPGIVFVSARNGVGKTSCADAMRHVLSGGGARQYDLAAANVHYSHREIRVVVTDGRQDVQLYCSDDGTVTWQGGDGAEAVPVEWISAYEQYRPALLYPEISAIIEKPSDLHDFLRDGLETAVLTELQRRVDDIREAGRRATRTIDASFSSLKPFLTDGSLPSPVAVAVNQHRIEPTAGGASAILSALEESPPGEQPDSLVAEWSVDAVAVENCIHALRELAHARADTVSGATAVLEALKHLTNEENEFLESSRHNDVCPVCGSGSANWRLRASTVASSLERDLARVQSAQRAVRECVKEIRGILPPRLPSLLRQSLEKHGESQLVVQWNDLVGDGDSLDNASIAEDGIRDLAARSEVLAAAYRQFRAQRLSEQRATIVGHTKARQAVETWLDDLEKVGPTASSGALAEKLRRWVDQRIKDTRTALFEPIAAQVKEIWSYLNSDSDLQVTDLRLAGGTRAAKKVEIGLNVGGVAVSPATTTPSILSTGQRNALTLATYFPRATQSQSPFRFLILDDPVHAFDSWRIRYLAERLRQMAVDYQIIVLSHDERLWSELQRHGQIRQIIRLDRATDRPSTVRATDKSHGILLLEDLERNLHAEDQSPVGTRQATTAMTLAMCRLALDVEVAAQTEILGRRAGMAEADIEEARGRARDTRRQISLMNEYATQAGCQTVDTTSYEGTLDALNAGSHGRAPSATAAKRRKWIADIRKLIKATHRVTA